MKSKPKKELEIVSTSDRNIEVIRVAGTSVTFRAFIGVDMAAAMESNVVVCNFRLRSSSFIGANRPKLSSLNSKAVLQVGTSKKLNALKAASNITVQGTIDITKQIPNSRISSIVNGAPVRVTKVVSLVDVGESGASQLKSEATSQPTNAGSIDFTASYSIDALMRSTKDPAAEYNVAPFHAPVGKIARGVRTSGVTSRLDGKAKKFRESFIETSTKPTGSKLVDVQERVVEVPFTFSISKSSLGKYDIEIDVMTKSIPAIATDGVRLQTIKFPIDLRRAYEDFIIPTQAPILNLTNVGSTRFLRIKQVDRNATSIRVYRRIFRDKLRDGDTEFEQIAEIPASQGEQVQFVDRPTQAGKCVYRVVPFNEISKSSGEFSSVVVPGMRMVERKRAPDTTTLLAVESDGRVVVSVYNLPNDVICARIVRKNLTTREREFTTPTSISGNSILRVARNESNLRFDDLPSRPDTSYEYKVITTDTRGDERESQRGCIIRYCGDTKLQSNRSIVTQSPKTTLDQEPKVTFQVNAPADPSTLDKIYDILIANGISGQYSTEIRQNRELFSKIVAFEMTRFDTVTGLNESFGIVKAGVFEDSLTTRKSSNVSTPVSGRNYIYSYRLLIRSPSTLFDSATVERTDLETGKTYSTKLKKFNSPLALGKGVLSSQVEQLRPISKIGIGIDPTVRGDNDLIAGRTALMGTVEVKIPDFTTQVQKLVARTTFRGNSLRWNVFQGNQEIDHIIVYADYNGKKAPLRALQYCGSDEMMYLDDRLLESLNNVSYYVRLVFTDFRQGELFGPAEIT